jgi:hypothetical protein
MAKFCAKTKYCLDVGRSHFFGILLGWVLAGFQPVWGRYWIFAILASFGYLKKLQNQRTISPSQVYEIFQNHKTNSSVFLKKIRFKEPQVLGLSKTSKNHPVSMKNWQRPSCF